MKNFTSTSGFDVRWSTSRTSSDMDPFSAALTMIAGFFLSLGGLGGAGILILVGVSSGGWLGFVGVAVGAGLLVLTLAFMSWLRRAVKRGAAEYQAGLKW
jgi:hypothetical protein